VKLVVFHPAADEEFAAAVAYYAGQADGLGERFYAEIFRLAGVMRAAPQLHRPWRHGARRLLARDFPYALVYVERPERLIVIAVAHCKRQPDYWRGRV